MKTKRGLVIFGVSVAACIVMICCGFFTPASAGDVVIVCNESVAADALSQDEIKNIFLGRKTMWGDGHTIHFVTLQTGRTHASFLDTYVGKTSPQFNNYWKKQVFTGRGKAPKSYRTAQGIIDYVSTTSGAIGYIPADEYHEHLKVIRYTQRDDHMLVPLFACRVTHK